MASRRDASHDAPHRPRPGYARAVSLLRALARRLTYANVVATCALFVALGGASYAALALPANSVGTKQLAFPLGASVVANYYTVMLHSLSAPPGGRSRRLVSTTLTLKRPAKLLVFGSAELEADCVTPSGQSPWEVVNLDAGLDGTGIAVGEGGPIPVGTTPFTVSFMRELSPPARRLGESFVPAGRHVIDLYASASGPCNTATVDGSQLAVVALPWLP